MTVDEETELMESSAVWVIVVGMVERAEVVGGRAVETTVEEAVKGGSCEIVTVIISLESEGGDAVLVTNVEELLDATKVGSCLTSPMVVVDKPGGTSDMLVQSTEAAVVTEIAASPPAAGAASTEKIPLGSGKVDLVDRFVDAVETELSRLGAETVSKVVMEGPAIVAAELEVAARLGVTECEEVEVTETVVGGSVGVVVVSGTAASPSHTVTLVDAAAAAAGESVHMSASEGVTGLEGETLKSVESGTEFKIVGAVEALGAEVAGGGGAATGLSLVGVFVSASCIWASSFSGVLRPDVVGGGPGLITGFGSKAGFPAPSCADTLARI